MTIDLRALLAAADEVEPATEAPLPVSASVADTGDKLCAAATIRITLTASPGMAFGQRQVRGALGAPGQQPVFLAEAVTLDQLLPALQNAYEQFTAVYTPPADEAATAVSGATELATAPTAEAEQTLSLF